MATIADVQRKLVLVTSLQEELQAKDDTLTYLKDSIESLRATNFSWYGGTADTLLAEWDVVKGKVLQILPEEKRVEVLDKLKEVAPPVEKPAISATALLPLLALLFLGGEK